MSYLIRCVLAKPRLILDEMCRLYEKFASYLRRVLCKTRLIFPRINGPNMAFEYLCQNFLKMRSTLDPRAPLLDFSGLLPKPIMATTRKKHFGYRGAFISNKLLEDLRECKVNELI